MTLIIAKSPDGLPVGSAPTWNSSPAPIFPNEAAASNYDLQQHVSGATSFALNGGSAALPTGVTISGTNLAYDGLGSAGTTTGIIIDATNAYGTTASSSFSVIVNATPTTFPVFEIYKAFMDYWGATYIPLSNLRYWEETPTYPTSFTSTSTGVAALGTAANAGSPGQTFALQDADYSATGTLTITASGNSSSPLTVCSQTKGGANLTGWKIRVDGDFVDIMGFEGAIYDINGDDCRVLYCSRNGTGPEFYVADGQRNRLAYCTFQGIDTNDQYFNIAPPVGSPFGNRKWHRIDHNRFLQHIGSSDPGGGSEIGQIGENNLGDYGYALVDSNFMYWHLNDSGGNKTVTNESELISFKCDRNFLINNAIMECNSHMSIRTGRQCVIYGNWIHGYDAQQGGGLAAGGVSNYIGNNHFHGLNSNDIAGESVLDAYEGSTTNASREECDNMEFAFNTGWEFERGIISGRVELGVDNENLQFYNNAMKCADTRPVIWGSDGVSPTYKGNVFGPVAISGAVPSGITEATPQLNQTGSSSYFYNTVVTSGNCDGTGEDIANCGIMTKMLNTAGALYDITGGTIPATAPDVGCIQSASSVTNDPILQIIQRAGKNAQAVIDWSPGHYVKTQGNHAQTTTSTYITGVKAYIDDEMLDSANIKGVLVAFSWGHINTTGSTYDWSQIDDVIGYIEAHNGLYGYNYKLVMELTSKTFQNDATDIIMPADLVSSHKQQYPATGTPDGYISADWRATVSSRYQSFLQQVCARYNGNATVEAIVGTHESAHSFGGDFPGDWDIDAYAQHFLDCVDTMKTYAPNKNTAININSLTGYMDDFIIKAYNEAGGVHTPDSGSTRSNSLGMQGLDMGSQGAATGLGDIRGSIYYGAVASAPVLGGYLQVGTNADDVLQDAQAQGLSHVYWVTTSSAPGYTWADILTAINADPAVGRPTYPSRY